MRYSRASSHSRVTHSLYHVCHYSRDTDEVTAHTTQVLLTLIAQESLTHCSRVNHPFFTSHSPIAHDSLTDSLNHITAHEKLFSSNSRDTHEPRVTHESKTQGLLACLHQPPCVLACVLACVLRAKYLACIRAG